SGPKGGRRGFGDGGYGSIRFATCRGTGRPNVRPETNDLVQRTYDPAKDPQNRAAKIFNNQPPSYQQGDLANNLDRVKADLVKLDRPVKNLGTHPKYDQPPCDPTSDSPTNLKLDPMKPGRDVTNLETHSKMNLRSTTSRPTSTRSTPKPNPYSFVSAQSDSVTQKPNPPATHRSKRAICPNLFPFQPPNFGPNPQIPSGTPKFGCPPYGLFSGFQRSKPRSELDPQIQLLAQNCFERLSWVGGILERGWPGAYEKGITLFPPCKLHTLYLQNPLTYESSPPPPPPPQGGPQGWAPTDYANTGPSLLHLQVDGWEERGPSGEEGWC
ncbi:hypothetical protein BDK51DRAFT_44717, partial [Blyttiomyces helicus]